MKHLIKIVGLLACSSVFAGESIYINNEGVNSSEANTAENLGIYDEVISYETKAMIDENRPVGGTSIRYYSATASAMQTVNTSDYTYNGAGCTASTTGYREIDEALDLPDKSRIISISAFGRDSSNSSQAHAYLSKVDGITGDYTVLNTYLSGNVQIPGRFNIGGFLDYTIGYHDGLLVRLWGTDSDIELCGFRIGYVPPDVASDVIFVNNFYR